MLYLDKPIGPIHGLMIYADHADPNLFYYVPERPRLARNDGKPEFVYLKYRRDITDNADFDPDTKQSLGGGFLAFTVDLGVEEDELKDIKRELGRYAQGEPKLAPIQFRKGSVHLTITKDAADQQDAPPTTPRGLTFFEEVYGATQPSLFGFNRATFGVVLSQEAATLFEAALKSGISPVGVIYNLEFLGLRPAFNVRITANYHRVYTELDIEFGAKGQIGPVSLGVDIGAAFQRLRDKGVIKVEVIHFTDEENLRKQADAAFEWFKTEMLKDFFKSSLEPPAMMKSNSGGGLLGQLNNLLGGLGTTQTGSSQPQMGAPTPVAPTPAQPPVSQASGVASSAQTSAAGSGGDVSSHGKGGNPSPFQVAFSLKYLSQIEDKERVFEYTMQAAVAREAAPQGLFSTIVSGLDLSSAITEVSLDDEFFNRLLTTVSMGGDLNASGVGTLAVNLEYPGIYPTSADPMHIDGFKFSPEELTPKTFTCWLNDQKDRLYRYNMDIHFKPDSLYVGKDAHVKTDWLYSRNRQLTLDPLDVVGLLNVEISLGKMEENQISQVQVTLSYDDPANDFNVEKTLVLKPGDAGTHWRIRLSDPDLKTYRYRLVYFLADSLQYQTDWQTSTESSLIINAPFQGQIKARLVPLLDAGNLIEANVNVVYHEEDTGYNVAIQKTFTGGAPLTTQEVIIPTIHKQPAEFSYDVTVIRADGSIFASEPNRITSFPAALPIADGEGKTSRIKVKLLNTDLASANLVAVKVQLVGEGENGDLAEALFTSSQTSDQTLTLVQPVEDGTFNYTYKITGYNLQGVEVPGKTGEDTSLNLMVALPTA